MYRQLLLTEFRCNRFFLCIAIIINLLSFSVTAYQQAGTSSYIAWTLISFFILLVVTTSLAGNEKRNRLFMQLPVNATQVFLAGWGFVLIWLALQISAWLLFAILFDDNLRSGSILEFLNGGLGVAVMIATISIGIDLSAFRPAFLQWLYIGLIVLLLLVAVNLEITAGTIGEDQGFYMVPFSMIDDGALRFSATVVTLVGLVFLDYLVFRFSDNYLT